MTIVTIGDDRKIDQIEKHLNKLVDVAALKDITIGSHLEREVVLVKLLAKGEQKADLDKIVDAFNGSLITVSGSQFIVEMSGSSEKVDELLKSLNRLTILELARSGVTGLSSDETAFTAE
jgi:acetolactate synthase-1/3 small subunit